MAGIVGTVALGSLAVGCFSKPPECELGARTEHIGVGPIERCDVTSSSGSGGGTPAGCVPSANDKPVDDGCGVFVSSSQGDDAGGKGTKEAPYKTLATALSKGSNGPVYACGEPFKEAVTLSAGVALYGALDCANGWAYDASKKTALTAEPDAIPLTVASSANGAEAHDLAITAADAMKDGGSSIALLDDHADLTLENVALSAGVGKAGAAGGVQNQVPTATEANGGSGADNMCGAASNAGGNPGQNMCLYMGNMVDVSGGIGGSGTNGTTGGDGGSGNPKDMTSNGGTGQTTMQCQPGQSGKQGSSGLPGDGARGVGDIDTSGYHGAQATKGKSEGSPAQGGGGGGGAKKCTSNGSGPGGGGGGAGGCGGAPGNPGQAGGSSIGLLALSAKLTLKTVTITTKDGGAGGVGGDGQAGGAGGQQGNQGGPNACPGGPGGAGGRGGSGGGGVGGHSVGIAIKGSMLTGIESTTVMLGKGAPGASGGDMDMTPQTKGDDGLGCKTLDFTDPMNPTACVM